MSKKNKTVTHLDKVIIILSFLYKHDLELLRNFIMNMKMKQEHIQPGESISSTYGIGYMNKITSFLSI